ncbi:hypothetical protein DBV39_07845 [Orrella marina]|uniref:Uncharacterized protein n=1 Tax=Orrella marina TaxID=2163011 RepID=A0A2R4XIK7_9BURK|nr:hypothetical protein DBV39_07845 [Orrella marina]
MAVHQTIHRTHSNTRLALRTIVDTIDTDRFTRIPCYTNTRIICERVIEVNLRLSQTAIETLHQIWRQKDHLGETDTAHRRALYM